MLNSIRSYNFFILASLILLAGCSAERKNIFSKSFHNTAARYNAYFYAKKQIDEVEKTIWENHEDNYGRILKIYPSMDSALAAGYKDKIDEAIKMSSIAIERHKNSHWVDDSYIMVGRARFYDLDFENAITTYKHVNKAFDDDKARHEALIRLIRTFIEYEEYGNAKSVSDYLDKEKLSRKNRKHLYLMRAYLYQELDDLDNMVNNLVEAAPLLKKKDDKARILFITGQIYQELGFDSEAYNYYRKSISSNPEFELDFHARLNMAQVTELKANSDLRSARKVFQKLLKDKKNKEFKDKIHYEWGVFEAKQGNLSNAIEQYTNTTSISKKPRQQGLAHYQLATIYYDSLKRYQLASAHYDSMLSVIPRDEDINFDLVETRHEVLDEFVRHLNTIQYNDSLLAIAQKDSADIRVYLTTLVEKEQEELERKKEEERKRSRRSVLNSSSFYMDEEVTLASNWYFDNPSAKAIGQNEFIREWGERPLSDYWRILDRISSEEESGIAGENIAEGGEGEAEITGDSEVMGLADRVNKLFDELPLTDEAQQEFLAGIEEAYYKLGNIYNLSLNEKQNALIQFELLLERFPNTEHKAEALYQLFLIYKPIDSLKSQNYKALLLKEFPYSKFAKLAENPNYTEESNMVAEKQKARYNVAYQMYDTGGYKNALKIINETLRSTEETYFTSHLELLKILVYGKTEDVTKYQYELSEFIKQFPDSELNPYAEKLLKASKEVDEEKKKKKGIAYIPYFDQQHYFVLIYPRKEKMDEFNYVLDEFNGAFRYADLKSSNLIFDDAYSIILVTEFENQERALEYYDQFIASTELAQAMPNFNLVRFVISKDNFNILYQQKGLAEYLDFFEKHY